MTFDTRRRRFLGASAVAFLAAGVARRSFAGAATEARLAALEQRAGGRLGVFALDAQGGNALGWRADERFGLCSTFKLLLAAVVLREAHADRLDLDETLAYTAADLVPHSPVTERQLAQGGMPVRALAEATQTTSDNLAANLLMKRLGGPAAVTARLRELGDPATRLDRYEPAMNRVPAGEVRDTTTPRAIAGTVAALFGGDLLDDAARATLRGWMIATQTGTRRLRAGLPPAWEAGDKTGTAFAPGMPNKTNDVAVVWRPERAPLVIAAYYEAPGEFDRMRSEDEAVLAEVGRIVADWVA
jgi:beta-lactamase class A